MDLKKVLEDELKYRTYISLETLERCITLDYVAGHLQAKRPISDAIVSRAPKLFAILLLLGHEHAIEQYLSNGFCDENFPIRDKSQIPAIGRTDLRQKLYDKQWCIPVVLDPDIHLDLPLEFVPPLIIDPNWFEHGSFGIIRSVRVAKGHLPRYDSSKVLAWKQISKREKDEWYSMMREVETLRARRHDNIIPLLASWNTRSMESDRGDKHLHLLYPFAEMNMEDWMNQSDPPEWPGDDTKLLKNHIYDTIMSLCDAVAFLHRNVGGVISSHHDLKPSNILLYGRTWKIADFGRTHLIRLSAGSNTEAKPGLGTFTYQPPEYFTPQGTRADTRHGRAFDIWALGCISVELLSLAVYGWSKQMIRRFRERRRTNKNPSTSFYSTLEKTDTSFHNNMNIVKGWMLELETKDGSPYLTSMLKIVGRMLNTKPHCRPLSWEVFLDLYELRRIMDNLTETTLETENRVQEPNRRSPICECEDNPLQRAAAARNTLRVRYLLKAGWSRHPVDILSLDDKGDEEIIRMLRIGKVMRGIQLRRKWKIALKAENSKITARPVSSQNPHQVANHGDRALTAAKESPVLGLSLSPVRRPLLQVDEQGMTTLHRLCESGHVWWAKSFLERGTPDFVSTILTSKDHKGRSPLHYAACAGYRDLAELLLENFALDTTVLVAEQDFDMRTPLHMAALHGHEELLKPLVFAHKFSADYLEMRDHQALTAYDLAFRQPGTAKTAAALAILKQSLLKGRPGQQGSAQIHSQLLH